MVANTSKNMVSRPVKRRRANPNAANEQLTSWPTLDRWIWTAATISAAYVIGLLLNRIVVARLPASALQKPRATVAAAEKMLQDARTALQTEDYPNVTKALNGTAIELQAALKEIDAAASSRPAPRKR